MHKADFRAVNMGRLTIYLHRMLNTTVEDHTGLKGKFDFSIDMDGAAKELAIPAGTRPTLGEMVCAAVEQVGFSVQASKVKVTVMMIERAERPSEN